MFEEKREGVMAIEAAVLPFRPVPSIHMRCRMTAAAARLATVAILAFAAPSFAQDKDKTVGQAPPSGASSFYLAQDTATMKCQVVNAQPAAGGNMKVIGAAHSTQASADTALAAEKTCTK
jgi:ABC-type sugar transport system substrate-binding protein